LDLPAAEKIICRTAPLLAASVP